MSIFQEEWWLDAANPGGWRSITLSENGSVVGRWPYSLYRHFGLSVGGMAPLTSTLGPWIMPLKGGVIARRKREIALISAMKAQFPPLVFFRQIIPPTQDNLLAFQLSGFSVDLEQTLEIDTRAGLESVWSGFPASLRNSVRRCLDVHAISHDVELDEFLAIHRRRMSSKGLKDRLDVPALRRIYSACLLRGAGRIIGLRDRHGEALAALLIVNDSGRMHHLLQTLHPTCAPSGSIEALTWSAIQMAHRSALIYDLDGIPNAAAASRLLRFGGRQTSRFVISYGSPAVLALRAFYKGLSYRPSHAKRFL